MKAKLKELGVQYTELPDGGFAVDIATLSPEKAFELGTILNENKNKSK